MHTLIRLAETRASDKINHSLRSVAGCEEDNARETEPEEKFAEFYRVYRTPDKSWKFGTAKDRR